ncbi:MULTISPECIES: hypothetical protein [unclassified Streptomyces]|uniref:hypothetical protein n=1 Tax=unclassified Streptomyces TaxID=2593676 RepID=UPI002DDB9C97|nr:hypothetical protein [Streptomyces sp. NBC_01445]WSE11357.1 hypothetical protein OG574_49915 [Streptomyces sp. NBC_01445]
MDVSSTLRILNVDPRQLPPAPDTTSGAEAFARIGRTSQPCVACGRPATATRIVDVPQAGSRWIDTCTPHMIATTKTAATRAPESQPLATLRYAVRQACVEAALLTAPLTEAECAHG